MMVRILSFIFFVVLFPVSGLADTGGPAPTWCVPERLPIVHVGLQASDPVGDYTKTITELESNRIDTISPYGAKVDSHVGGLTKGDIAVHQKVQVGGRRMANASCLWLDHLEVVIKLDQTVYVAKEYKPDSCMYGSIWEHEHKHVRTDREIMNKYRPIFVEAIGRYIQSNPVVGPFDMELEKKNEQDLIAQISKVIDSVSSQMEAERAARQQGVDNLDEYTRVSKVCDGKR